MIPLTKDKEEMLEEIDEKDEAQHQKAILLCKKIDALAAKINKRFGKKEMAIAQR